MTSIYDNGAEYDSLALGPASSAETDFYASCIPPSGSVLELACGIGRFSIPLAERGLNFTGLDNSEAMLAAAQSKDAVCEASPAFAFGDMRDFALDMPFDLIFLPNNLLGYTRSDDKTVAVSETVSYDATTQVPHALWHYQMEGEPAEVRSLDLRTFFPQELEALLSLSGFTIEAKYGGFDKPLFSSAFRQQVIVCLAS